MKHSYLQGNHQDLNLGQSLMSKLLGSLRALDWHYRTAHWQVWGEAQYSDHLMFQRFYETLPQEIDDLAEKMVGFYGPHVVNSLTQMNISLGILQKWNTISCPIKKSLRAERDLQDIVKTVYHQLKSMDQLSLGLDDYLMSLASAHEPNIYLLQQRLYKSLTKQGHFTSLEKSWSGDSTFAPIRQGEEVEEDPFDIEEGKAGTGSAEKYFRNSPLHQEVRLLQESGAITNLPDVAEKSTWMGRTTEEEVLRARKAPPSTKKIIRDDPYQGEFSSLGRYVLDTRQPIKKRARMVTSKKKKSMILSGITYEYTKDKFLVVHSSSGKHIISYNDGTPIKNPKSFVTLADRVLRDVDWSDSQVMSKKEKIREITRQFQRLIQLVPDSETGELYYRVAGDK